MLTFESPAAQQPHGTDSASWGVASLRERLQPSLAVSNAGIVCPLRRNHACHYRQGRVPGDLRLSLAAVEHVTGLNEKGPGYSRGLSAFVLLDAHGTDVGVAQGTVEVHRRYASAKWASQISASARAVSGSGAGMSSWSSCCSAGIAPGLGVVGPCFPPDKK